MGVIDLRTNFFSYATDKERFEKTEAMEQYNTDRCFGFERVYNREHLFRDVVEGSVPEGCYTLVISGLEDLGTGLCEIRDSLRFIEDMGYKLEVLYDYESQLADVDCLIDIKELLQKLE
jgi:hypothetical protein